MPLLRRRSNVAAKVLSETLVDAPLPAVLSVRDRLRKETLDGDVVDLINELGLGLPKRGGRRRPRSDESARASDKSSFPSPNVLARMGFRHAAHAAEDLPPPKLAEIAIAGRSNVGKSSLLNALTGKSSGSRGTLGVAAVANRPGVTRSINVYANADGAQLVDLPGYGFAFAAEEEVARWQAAMRAYLTSRGQPLRVILVVDARQSLKQSDREFLLWLNAEARVPLHVVMSKCDLVPATELARRYTMMGAELRALQLEYHLAPHHMISSRTGGGVELFRASLAVVLPDKLLRRAAKRSARGQTTHVQAASEEHVATPAARRFAEQLEARRAKAAAVREASEAPAPLGREERRGVARDSFLQRQARRTRRPRR